MPETVTQGIPLTAPDASGLTARQRAWMEVEVTPGEKPDTYNANLTHFTEGLTAGEVVAMLGTIAWKARLSLAGIMAHCSPREANQLKRLFESTASIKEPPLSKSKRSHP